MAQAPAVAESQAIAGAVGGAAAQPVECLSTAGARWWHSGIDLGLAVVALRLAGVDMASHTIVAVSLAVAALAGSLAGAVLTKLHWPTVPRRSLDHLWLRGLNALWVTLVVSTVSLVFQEFGWVSSFTAPLFFCAYFGALTLSYLSFLSVRQIHLVPEPVLILGTGRFARATCARLRSEWNTQQTVLGFLSMNGQPTALYPHEPPVLGTSQDLAKVLRSQPVAKVYIAARVLEHPDAMQHAVDVCETVGVPFALPATCMRFLRARPMNNPLCENGWVHYRVSAGGALQELCKRLFDVVVTSIALLLLWPLLLLTALAIKLSSPGPVLFKQVRLGQHGRRFHLLKFRSMVVNAEQCKGTLLALNEQCGPVFKMQDDPRVTPMGRFIRRYSIDELPQLVNILRGEMSIVGPRPALPAEVDEYELWQHRRLAVRPGLTCYWQVQGRNLIRFEEWMRLDLKYVDGWDFATDLSLILKTVPVVLGARGAS
jgi:exopolysaccharide biosynthesis polyprenyl glycosylphosphotransferase